MEKKQFKTDMRHMRALICALNAAAACLALCVGIGGIFNRGAPWLSAVEIVLALLLLGAVAAVQVLVLLPLLRVCKLFLRMADADRGEGRISEADFSALSGRRYGFIGRKIQFVVNSIHSDSKAKTLNAEVALYALQSEINPHFLYNALEVIRNYAVNSGVDEISDMTLALARIFRYSISRPGEVATLADEIYNVKNYMKIQQYRFPDRFAIAFDLDEQDDNVMKCTLPVLTLQPIVENALSHGLEGLMRQGSIRLRAVATERNLIVTVTDNGVGISPEKLEALRSRLNSGFTPQGDTPGRQLNRKTGVSLNNVNNRLKIYFGSEYGLSVTSCPNQFTTVEIVVPRIPTV